jgi:hypothetical protein
LLAVVPGSRQLKDLLLVQCSSSIPRDYGGLIGYFKQRGARAATQARQQTRLRSPAIALDAARQDAREDCAAIAPLPVAPRGAAR